MMSMMNRWNINGHHGGYDEVPQHPLDRLEPLRKSEALRKITFDSWPKDALIGCNDLIEDGFYYMKTSDKVQCAYCGGVLGGWQKGDSVHEEHKRHFGNCPKVRGDPVSDNGSDLETDGVPDHSDYNDYNNLNTTTNEQVPPRDLQCLKVRGDTVSDDESDLETDGKPDFTIYNNQNPITNEQVSPRDLHQPHNFGDINHDIDATSIPESMVPKVYNSNFSLYNQRLESYENWPSDHNLKPEELATAGLYYKGSGDKCQCFLCGGILEEWEKEDIPKEEHKKWFPTCYNST